MIGEMNKTSFSIDADGNVSAMLPIELIWTEDYRSFGKDIENITTEWETLNAIWANRPITSLRPHTDLFDFLLGASNLPFSYTNWYSYNVFRSRGIEPPMDDDSLLEHRYYSSQFFAKELEQFGLESQALRIQAKYDSSRNIFMVNDGHHRCVYLARRGYRKIPASISFEDFVSWLNPEASRKVNEEIASQARSLIYTPVFAPLTHNIPVARDFTFKSRLDHLTYYFGRKKMTGTLLDVGSNTGYFSFHFLREGLTVVGSEPDKQHLELAKRLGDLYRLPHNFTSEPIETYLNQEVEFDGCLLLTVFYHIVNSGDYKRVLQLLNERISKYIVWESGNDPEMEKSLIMKATKFCNYDLIARTHATGKTRELGVFWKEGY